MRFFHARLIVQLFGDRYVRVSNSRTGNCGKKDRLPNKQTVTVTVSVNGKVVEPTVDYNYKSTNYPSS